MHRWVSSPDPFAFPDAPWTRLGPGLSRMRRATCAMLAAVVVAGCAVLAWWVPSWRWWALAAAVLTVLALVVGWPLLGRSVRSWGYAERGGDLAVTRGMLWRRIDLVPYGRMQMVDVRSGPLERWFGLVSVRLHTAAPATHAHIPGLVPQEAARLRDTLSRRGEQEAAGL